MLRCFILRIFVRLGLKSFFNLQPDVEVIGEAGNGIDGIKLALDLKPDVVVMDLMMPDEWC